MVGRAANSISRRLSVFPSQNFHRKNISFDHIEEKRKALRIEFGNWMHLSSSWGFWEKVFIQFKAWLIFCAMHSIQLNGNELMNLNFRNWWKHHNTPTDSSNLGDRVWSSAATSSFGSPMLICVCVSQFNGDKHNRNGIKMVVERVVVCWIAVS